MFGVSRWFVSIVLVALSVTAGASATSSHDAAIDPGQRVSGMLVVQGPESDADLSIWTYCNPIVTAPGPEARTCSVPRSRRIFAGYGIWGESRNVVDEAWHKRAWALWIDGRARRPRSLWNRGPMDSAPEASGCEEASAASPLGDRPCGCEGNSLDPVQIASGRGRRVHLQRVEVHHLAALAICRSRGEWGGNHACQDEPGRWSLTRPGCGRSCASLPTTGSSSTSGEWATACWSRREGCLDLDSARPLELEQRLLDLEAAWYPVRSPVAPTTRWQGSTIGIRLRFITVPTARAARGCPIFAASAP